MKLLFVVTAFYPQQAIGSIRITKFAKFLHKLGVHLTVISLKPPPWATRDETLWFPELEALDWYEVDQSQFFKMCFQRARVAAVGERAAHAPAVLAGSRTSLKRWIRSRAHIAYTLLKAIDWSFQVRKQVVSTWGAREFDVVFCSYPSLASPLIGMQFKRAGIANKLVIDFRDPVISMSYKKSLLLTWLQGTISSAADFKTFVSDGVRESVIGKSSGVSTAIVPNGYDKEDWDPQPTKNDKSSSTRFVYTGAMYGGRRDLRPFFDSLAACLSRSTGDYDAPTIEYAGDESDVLIKQAREFGLDSLVIDHGRLTRSDSLKLQGSADVCLLATWNSDEERGVLTGKLFEYFMTKKPVLAVVGGDRLNSEVASVINKINAGFCFETANIKGRAELEVWLAEVMAGKKHTGYVQHQYNDLSDQYDIKNITAVLHSYLCSL